MGLDMYLSCNSKPLTDKVHEGEPYGDGMTDFYRSRGIVMYWRKENAIHKWFVDNVQDGVDDCGDYEVSVEQLRTLMDTCKKVIDSCTLVDGEVMNGMTYSGGRMEPNMQEGKVVDDPEAAAELLPTLDGFFFGDTDYDQWYYWGVKRTAEEIERMLGFLDVRHESWGGEYHVMPSEPDWRVVFRYSSSW